MLKIIPLTTDPNQNLTCTIPINGKNITLSLNIRYNGISGYWTMSVTKKGALIIDSLPLITGQYPAADILGQYQYLGIGSAVVVPTGTLKTENPDDTNLGADFVLMWGDTNVS